MKTTLVLPDELMREVRLRAVEENRTLQDTIADLLRRGLARQPGDKPAERCRTCFPLIQCAHPARPEEEMTPERVAAWLRVFGMVNSVPGFAQQPQVINGFSDLILELYGPERGAHARSAVGMAELPFQLPVEIEAEVELA